MTDALLHTTSFTYDRLGRRTYDFAGNMLTLGSSNAGAASMTYTYDGVNRLATVTDAAGQTT
jgi:YD repeat-containing protein